VEILVEKEGLLHGFRDLFIQKGIVTANVDIYISYLFTVGYGQPEMGTVGFIGFFDGFSGVR
jgi:hypothetical protein